MWHAAPQPQPQPQVRKRSTDDVAGAIVETMPILLLLTFVATLGLTVITSIRLTGHAPCDNGFPCDISIYAAWPKHGLEEVIFRVGFSIVVIQGVVMGCGRVSLTGSLTPVPFYLLTTIGLMTMAFVPFWASSVHHKAAAASFLLLGISQIIDACEDSSASSSLTYTRYAIIFLTNACWWVFGVCEMNMIAHLPILEYVAVILGFSYFLTWSYQQHSMQGVASKAPYHQQHSMLGSVDKEIMPQPRVRQRRRGEDIAAEVVKSVPIVLLPTFVATLVLTMITSIWLTGHAPCDNGFPCDISIYAAWPKHGLEEVIFRVGFSIVMIQCLVMGCGRVMLTGSFAPVPFYVLTLVCLMTMAFVPFWASSVHHKAAAASFVFLGIGEIIDACEDSSVSSPLKYTRYAVIFLTNACWWVFGVCEMHMIAHLPILEYVAAILGFSYFLTWSYQQHAMEAAHPQALQDHQLLPVHA